MENQENFGKSKTVGQQFWMMVCPSRDTQERNRVTTFPYTIPTQSLESSKLNQIFFETSRTKFLVVRPIHQMIFKLKSINKFDPFFFIFFVD